MNVIERNKLARKFITDKLDLVSTLEETHFKTLPDYRNFSQKLHDLIFVKQMGFRGVVATAITGKFLNPNFDPLNDFYSCNPRSIFEKGIRLAFDNRVPCGKSDPLNVAKNTYVLDYEWANGKRPQSSAVAAVDCLTRIESAPNDEKEHLINFFFFKLLEYSDSVASIEINLPEEQGLAIQAFATKLKKFILEYPESGTTPQLVVSLLLEKLYEHSTVVVEGGNESVFGTNTTSKKPADIWLESNGVAFSLYEVTLKSVDYNRLDDCFQSLNAQEMLDRPVHFICRMPADVSSLGCIIDGTLNHKGKTFNFLDIGAFVHSTAALLSNTQIEEIIATLQIFMKDIKRPVATKEGWNSIFC